MKFTCLSKGKGFHCPPCNILSIDGVQVLFDCPLDLSALSAFSPLPVYPSDECCRASLHSEAGPSEKPLDATNLIHAEPWYKTVKGLKQWDTSFINVVLICSPMGMLGLPFLTRDKDFAATVYVTEAAARIGHLMMQDLVAMHKEIRQFYGPKEPYPEWLLWDEIELLPSALKEMLIGKDGGDFGGWMPLYSATDVNNCMQRVQSLKFAEEACYNGTLLLKAFSSGLDIGTCNWSITSPKKSTAYLSGSIFSSEIATEFDYHALQGSDIILFSDCTEVDLDNNLSGSVAAETHLPFLSEEDDMGERVPGFCLNDDDIAEESKKLTFLCSLVLESAKNGGSVLLPISRLGLMLQLLEQITCFLQSSDLKVPIYIISSIAEDLIAFLNIIPEWVCKQRQEKFYSGQGLFSFMDLLSQKRLHLFPAVHSPQLLAIWQEPCIVFCPHWSLRIGPSVHLLRRWCPEYKSLLIMEEIAKANVACLPFQPMAIKALHCSFPCGMRLQQAESLFKFLKPKYVLLPEKLKQAISRIQPSYSFIFYKENETTGLPKLSDGTKVDIEIDLLSYTKLEKEDISIAQLKGELLASQGKIRLGIGNEPILCLGSVDLQSLLKSLKNLGLVTRIEEVLGNDGSKKISRVHVVEESKKLTALIEIKRAHTIISTDDESLGSVIYKGLQSTSLCFI